MKQYEMMLVTGLLLAGCAKEPAFQEFPAKEAEHTVVEDVYGRVTDQYGNPVGGAIVTDGYSHVLTDSNGEYCITSANPSGVNFVSASFSPEYGPAVTDGVPLFYCMLSPFDGKARRADIQLLKLPSPVKNFSILMTADPQIGITGNGTDNIAYSSKDMVTDLFGNLKFTASEAGGRCIGICLGNIADNHPEVYPQYRNGMRELGIPFFNTIGDRDHFVTGNDSDDGCAATFESIFGPRNYSFNIGDFHFIVMDDCIFEPSDGGTCGQETIFGFEDNLLHWLEGDLSFVSRDTPVMICLHAPLIDDDGKPLAGANYRNTEEFLNLFKGYEKVYMWSGHSHIAHNAVSLSQEGLEGFESHTLARSTGLYPIGEYVNPDGSPRGCLRIDITGREISWSFCPFSILNANFRGAAESEWKLRDWYYENGTAILRDGGKLDESYQLHAYDRGVCDDDFVYAGIFMWDAKWSAPVLNIGGNRIAMTRDCIYDPGYKEVAGFYGNAVLPEDASIPDYVIPEHGNMFCARVPAGSSGKASVEVTDRFGRTFARTVNINPVKYDDGLLHLTFDFESLPDGCPQSTTDNIEFTSDSGTGTHTFSLSRGYYDTENRCLKIISSGSRLSLPQIHGYKLERISCRAAGNRFSTQEAKIVFSDGSEAPGGSRRVFAGNCTDGWDIVLREEGTKYFICSTGGTFSIAELRLAYREAQQTDMADSQEDYVIEDGSDIIF